MYDIVNFVIILIFAQLAIYFFYILSIQFDKLLAIEFRPYVYLIAGLIALYQVMKFFLKFELQFYKISVFYFWIIFLIGMLVLFFKERKKIQMKKTSQKIHGRE